MKNAISIIVGLLLSFTWQSHVFAQGAVSNARFGNGFGCPAPMMWQMKNGVATCATVTPNYPGGILQTDGKTITVYSKGGQDYSMHAMATIVSKNGVMTITPTSFPWLDPAASGCKITNVGQTCNLGGPWFKSGGHSAYADGCYKLGPVNQRNEYCISVPSSDELYGVDGYGGNTLLTFNLDSSGTLSIWVVTTSEQGDGGSHGCVWYSRNYDTFTTSELSALAVTSSINLNGAMQYCP